MRKFVVALALVLLLVPAGFAAGTPDVMTPIRQLVDAFNTGDIKTADAAYSSGTVTIVDEFAPHLWAGTNAAHEWSAEYDKHATATGVTDGVVKTGAPTRSVVDKDTAYVILPALYTYKEKGKPMAEEGKFTFVLRVENGSWKIQGWTWTGAVPQAQK
jgi:hypothetical protein